MHVQGCKPREVAEWLSDAASAKKLNVVSVHLVSSHTGEGGPVVGAVVEGGWAVGASS